MSKLIELQSIEDNLPSKLSDLIKLAVKDLTKVEKMPNYSIDMSTWHSIKSIFNEEICSVGFAGSVMACELQIEHGRNAIPFYFTGSLDYKFNALDEIRKYNIQAALMYTEPELFSEKKYEYSILESQIIDKLEKLRRKVMTKLWLSKYSENPKLFKLNMLYIAKELKKINL